MIARVSSLHIYPIKGCRGIEKREARVLRSGLEHDRRYMVAHEDGSFASQRSDPRLCLVSTEIDRDRLIVHTSDRASLELSLSLQGQEKRAVTIWRDTVQGTVSEPGSAWFSAFLGKPVSLVYVESEALRPVNPKHAEHDDRVGFADAYPVLAAGNASLEDLKGRMPRQEAETMTMDRFRPNICLDGLLPFEEDEFSRLSIGEISFFAPRLCERCVVTTIDPKPAEAGREPLRTLAAYRKWDGAVWFGVNWIPRSSGTVRVGDALKVERRAPRRDPALDPM